MVRGGARGYTLASTPLLPNSNLPPPKEKKKKKKKTRTPGGANPNPNMFLVLGGGGVEGYLSKLKLPPFFKICILILFTFLIFVFFFQCFSFFLASFFFVFGIWVFLIVVFDFFLIFLIFEFVFSFILLISVFFDFSKCSLFLFHLFFHFGNVLNFVIFFHYTCFSFLVQGTVFPLLRPSAKISLFFQSPAHIASSTSNFWCRMRPDVPLAETMSGCFMRPPLRPSAGPRAQNDPKKPTRALWVGHDLEPRP